MKITYLVLPITFCIASCSSTPNKRPESEFSFVTHITDDGTKKFSYSVISEKPRNNKRPNKGGGSGNRGGGRGGRGGGQGRGIGGSRERGNPSEQMYQMKEKLLKNLERTLFEKQYCLEGYSELDSFYDRQMSQFKGQCQEKASEKDLVNFPNQ